MKTKKIVSRIGSMSVILTFLVMHCAPTLPLIQFQDIQKQKLRNNRAVFHLDIDMSPILDCEGITPIGVISIKSFGKIFVAAKGFKNLYWIVPKDQKVAVFKAVKLKREEVLPFQKVLFEWAENEQILFKWQDSEGVHENVIDKKCKAH